MMLKFTTLCYIEKDNKYLMLYRNKKKNDINALKWIGVGGHFLAGETADECLVREVLEETGLTLLDYELRGKIIFHIDELMEVCYVYTASNFKGELICCDEGTLEWVNKTEILNLSLWEGDFLFLKNLLNGDPYFEMELLYKNDKLISYEVK